MIMTLDFKTRFNIGDDIYSIADNNYYYGKIDSIIFTYKSNNAVLEYEVINGNSKLTLIEEEIFSVDEIITLLERSKNGNRE